MFFLLNKCNHSYLFQPKQHFVFTFSFRSKLEKVNSGFPISLMLIDTLHLFMLTMKICGSIEDNWPSGQECPLYQACKPLDVWGKTLGCKPRLDKASGLVLVFETNPIFF
jgi:hypothetical protein